MISQYGDPVVLSGTASTTLTPVAINNRQGIATFARQMSIRNDGATNALSVSIDGGTTFLTVGPGVERTINGPFNNLSLKAAAATTPWSAMVSVA